MSTIGCETVPPPRKINNLQSLMKLKPKANQQFGVFAYALNKDMLKPDGTLDDLHAVGFMLGMYEDEEMAVKFAKDIMTITGHSGIIVRKYAQPMFLSSKPNQENLVEVVFDSKGKILEMESNDYKREKDLYEKRIKLEKDLIQEAEEETDPTSIEHFKRHCYVAIKNYASYVYHKKEHEKALESYKKRQEEVKNHYAKFPEHEKEWLPFLKEKLTERGELELYYNIEGGYKELRNELLGLTPQNSTTQCDTNDNKSEDSKPNDNKSEDNKSEDSKPNDNKSEDSKLNDSNVSNDNNHCDNGVCTAGDRGLLSNDGKLNENKLGESKLDKSGVGGEECDNGVCMAENTGQVLTKRQKKNLKKKKVPHS
jgi:hypothetical protein